MPGTVLTGFLALPNKILKQPSESSYFYYLFTIARWRNWSIMDKIILPKVMKLKWQSQKSNPSSLTPKPRFQPLCDIVSKWKASVRGPEIPQMSVLTLWHLEEYQPFMAWSPSSLLLLLTGSWYFIPWGNALEITFPLIPSFSPEWKLPVSQLRSYSSRHLMLYELWKYFWERQGAVTACPFPHPHTPCVVPYG